MKRTMISKEEFDILVKTAIEKERDDIYEKGRQEGYDEGYDKGCADTERERY